MLQGTQAAIADAALWQYGSVGLGQTDPNQGQTQPVLQASEAAQPAKPMRQVSAAVQTADTDSGRLAGNVSAVSTWQTNAAVQTDAAEADHAVQPQGAPSEPAEHATAAVQSKLVESTKFFSSHDSSIQPPGQPDAVVHKQVGEQSRSEAWPSQSYALQEASEQQQPPDFTAQASDKTPGGNASLPSTASQNRSAGAQCLAVAQEIGKSHAQQFPAGLLRRVDPEGTVNQSTAQHANNQYQQPSQPLLQPFFQSTHFHLYPPQMPSATLVQQPVSASQGQMQQQQQQREQQQQQGQQQQQEEQQQKQEPVQHQLPDQQQGIKHAKTIRMCGKVWNKHVAA